MKIITKLRHAYQIYPKNSSSVRTFSSINSQFLTKIPKNNSKMATGVRKFATKEEYQKHWDHCQGNEQLYKTRAENHHPSLQAAIDQKLLNNETHVIDIFDFDKFHARLTDLTTAFHEDFFTHALAIKSQSISGILCYANKHFAGKVGIEGASLGEVTHGSNAGFAARDTIYDSPVKTKADLEIAVQKNFHINLDNNDDMEVIQQLLQKYPNSTSTFGVRINPLAGEGAISTASTAGIGSKFGLIYCEETFDEILGYFKKYPFLAGVHCHVGSQGCSLELLANGARIITEAAEKLNQHLDNKNQVNIIDIGGGVPTSYDSEFDAVPFIAYRKVLEKICPNLLSGKYRVITEFGRAIFTKCGVTVTKVFSKKGSDANGSKIDQLRFANNLNPILFAHVGSNVFFREVYQPESWRRRFTVYNSDGSINQNQNMIKYDIAGPLCFQGDYLCKEVLLPDNVEKGDLLVMHETGGYSMSLYSKYNSLPSHDCYSWSENDGFKLMKPKETMDQVLNFWGPYE